MARQRVVRCHFGW